MDRMVFGIFPARDNAEMAITHLEDNGFKAKDISIVMRDQGEAREIASDTGTNVVGGAVSGAVTGGVLGGLAGLLIGVGAITIPGLGALLIGGPLAAALGLTGAAATTASGAATGALAGGLLGALMGLGLPEQDARYYEDRIKAGGILVIVPTFDMEEEEEARRIMEDNGADQVKSVDAPQVQRRETEEEYTTPAYYSEVKARRGRRTKR